MNCHLCNKPLGNPCAVCRTISRIQFAWGQLVLPGDDVRVLNLVRDCAGGVLDLLETQNTRRKAGEAPEVADSGRASSHKERSEDRESRREKGSKKDREGKRSHPREERKRRRGEREVEPEKERKEKSASRKEKKSRPLEVKVEEPEEEESSGASLYSDSPVATEEPGSARDRVNPGGENRAEGELSAADREVLENPQRHGLGFLPRGSVAGHFGRREAGEEDPEARRPNRPQSPSRSPVSRRHPRGENRGKKHHHRASKGKKKRERDRAWRQAHQQERWRPRGR